MEERYVKKCEEIFEGKAIWHNIENDLKTLQGYFDIQIVLEYQYILENYAGAYVREDYGFRSLEKTPLTDKRGFDTVISFFALQGRNNIFEKYEMYKQQLPIELMPIGDIDGGNLLCMNRRNGYLYCWVHDEDANNIHLVHRSFSDLIESFQGIGYETDANLGIVETRLSLDLLDALKNYKKN